MTDDEFYAVADEFVGDRDALFGIGTVIADVQLDLLAEDAARGIDVFDRLLGPVLELGAERRTAAGEGAGDAKLDLCRSGIRESKAKTEGQGKREPLSHSFHLWMKTGRHSPASRRNGLMSRFKPETRGIVIQILASPRLPYRRGGAIGTGPHAH